MESLNEELVILLNVLLRTQDQQPNPQRNQYQMTNMYPFKLPKETILNAALDTVKLTDNVEANSILDKKALFIKVDQ